MKNRPPIINTSEKYLLPGPDQVRFATQGQTLSLVLGSCISTVFIARSSEYVLAANHIMIAREHHPGIIAKKSARQQIDEILKAYHEVLKIPDNDILCLHLVGAGKKVNDNTFWVHDENIAETRTVLAEKNIVPLFDDTRSYYFATYSLGGDDISVFIEDKLGGAHLSYIIDLKKLFSLELQQLYDLPASALKPCNRGFEKFVELGAIVFITGERNRPNV
ncbi:MAG TPA: hypothetical protein PKN50_07830 [Spirochaetota bacterium]|nr:hypothetical protein [Spirochaetota bacterium]HPV40847.1 hypothetical protein [Spirochaetota bacterium]